MKLLLALTFATVNAVLGTAQANRLRIVFQPESDQFAEGPREYDTLWAREGQNVKAAMEAVSGLKCEDREVRAIVREVASSSGYKEQPF